MADQLQKIIRDRNELKLHFGPQTAVELGVRLEISYLHVSEPKGACK